MRRSTFSGARLLFAANVGRVAYDRDGLEKRTMAKRLIRAAAACARLGIGKTRLYEYARAGRLKQVDLGPRAVGFIEDDEKSPGSIDALIDDLIKQDHVPRPVPDTSKEARTRKARRARR
jgi:predicted DNA-binding transcriptional regulator AlpA